MTQQDEQDVGTALAQVHVPRLDIAPVVCVGEALVLLSAIDQDAHERPIFGSALGGAEANVAYALAQLGIPVQWLGRLGADPLGDLVSRLLTSVGVRLDHVAVDPLRPTGLYLRTESATGRHMHYYRTGSTASVMGPKDLPSAVRETAPVIHVSGITAALSASCLALVEEIVGFPRLPGQLVSFDVNWRPSLWEDDGPQTLSRLARHADIVFVGADEAEAVWGTDDPAQVAALLDHPPLLVVKNGEIGATAIRGSECVFVPAHSVDVIDSTGAGDAFAAGFLAGQLRGFSLPQSLRFGHVVATKVLAQREDVVELPPLPSLLAELHALERAGSDQDGIGGSEHRGEES